MKMILMGGPDPLITFYGEKGLLKRIDGDQPIDQVFQDIMKALG